MQPRATAAISNPHCATLRRGLPFGVVMATAGASVLAGDCGLQSFVAPLLTLAVLQALWIPIAGTWRHRADLHLGWRVWWTIGPAQEHSGIHTVPLGLAVITSGLVTLTAHGSAPWASALAVACLALTWLLMIACVGRFMWSLMSRSLMLRELDGAWFLVPAALLGAAIATDAVAQQTVGYGTAILAGLALVAALLGWLGYWAVALAALVRVWRFGLGGVPQAPWWIAMGCAGLAAAALGRVVQSPGSGWSLQTFLIRAMVATDLVAVVLCVPVLAIGIVFLLRRCRYRARAPWPPTFSTAVFALGCLATGDILQSAGFRVLGLGAGYATLAFWVVTAAWNTGRAGIGCLRNRNG